MDESPEPRLCHCFATRQLARHVSKLYERHLANARITSAQFTILTFLQRSSGSTMSELSREMVMDRTTLLRAIKPLQRDGLVTTSPQKGDARKLVFALSRKGARKIEEAVPFWQAAQREYEVQIGAGRAARLRHDFLEITSDD
jgi:DNA-binding MarR family transcriptional regulator